MLLPNLGFDPCVNLLPFSLIPVINQFLILNPIFGKNVALHDGGKIICVCV